jgi:hypothetical protein
MMTDELRDDLRAGKVVFVRFTKKSGEIRNMICTTNLSYIPKTQRPTGNLSYNPSQIRVYDLIAREWRSMIDENVIEFSEYTALVA